MRFQDRQKWKKRSDTVKLMIYDSWKRKKIKNSASTWNEFITSVASGIQKTLTLGKTAMRQRSAPLWPKYVTWTLWPSPLCATLIMEPIMITRASLWLKERAVILKVIKTNRTLNAFLFFIRNHSDRKPL